MKIAIIYCSKYGTTEKVCHTICKMVGNGNEVDLSDLRNQKKLDVREYDAIVLGSPVYEGKPRRQMVEFCKNNDSIGESVPLYHLNRYHHITLIGTNVHFGSAH